MTIFYFGEITIQKHIYPTKQKIGMTLGSNSNSSTWIMVRSTSTIGYPNGYKAHYTEPLFSSRQQWLSDNPKCPKKPLFWVMNGHAYFLPRVWMGSSKNNIKFNHQIPKLHHSLLLPAIRESFKTWIIQTATCSHK